MKLDEKEVPFDLKGSLVSRIPDLGELRQRVGLGESVSQQSWRASTAYTWQNAGRQILGNVAVRQGFELDIRKDVSIVRNAVLEPVRQLIELTDVADVLSEFDDVISEAALAAGMAIVEVIPIVQAIVKLAFSMGKLVRQAIQTAREYDKPMVRLIEPVSFSPRADEDLYNLRLLAPVNRTQDWTSVFSPPAWGLQTSGVSAPFGISTTVARGYRGAKHGVQIMADDVGDSDWLGCVPGTGIRGKPPQLHEGFQFDAMGMRDTGDYYMTPRNEAPSLWQTVINPATPAMFAVDAKAVIQRWSAYLHNLWVWARDSKNPHLQPEVRAGIQKWCRDNFGMKEQKTEYGIPGSHVVDSALMLLRNQEKALEDPVRCAYVDERYAAISGNTWLRSLWEKGRRRLVEGDALASKVDMSMVEAQGADGFQFLVALNEARAKQPSGSKLVPRLDISFEKPKGRPEPRAGRSTRRGGGGGLVVAAAAGLGALALLRK